MRKTAHVLNPQVPKHDVAPPAQTCRHRGYANQDTHANDFSMARQRCVQGHACPAQGLRLRGQPYLHKKLFTSCGAVLLWQVTRTTTAGGWATHRGCLVAGQMGTSVLGTCPVTPRTCWWPGGFWRQDGARAAVPAHPACRLWPHSHHRSPPGRDAGKRELSQTTTGSLTSQPSPRHPTSEKI